MLDFFAGSGTTGEASAKLGSDFILVDTSGEAFVVMKKRLAFASPEVIKLRGHV